MYSLWWPNHMVPAHVSKVAKNLRVVCENIARMHKCLILWWFEIWEKSNTLTHNHNYLMGTITFEVHPITPTSPRNTFAITFKSILIPFAFIFFAYFSFKHSMHAHIKEREVPNYVSLNITILLCRSTQCYTWLVGFSGEMVIYAFLLGFSSPSYQKEWYES